MNLFDDALAFDVRSLFLNPREFAQTMLVDGVEAIGIWDDAVEPADGRYDDNVETWGVSQTRRTLFLPSGGDGGIALPSPRQELNIDGVLWTVDDAADLHGMIRVNLYRNGA